MAPERAVEAHPVDQGRQAVRLGAVVGVAALAPIAHQADKLQNGQVLGDRGCETPARAVSTRTDSSPSWLSRDVGPATL